MQVSGEPRLPCRRSVHVGRQPIYARNEGLAGYELLYRSGSINAAEFSDGDHASLSVMAAALVEIGLTTLTNGRTAFINLTRNGVLCEFPRLFPRERVVFEILEDVCSDADVMLALRRMAADGYSFALDDFCESEHNAPLLDCVRILKLDIQGMDDAAFAHHARKFAHFHLIAEKVETRAHYERCLELGLAAWQGYWFSPPAILSCALPEVSHSSVLALLMHLRGHEQPDLQAAERLLATDPALMLRLLRALPADAREISSIGEALALLGTERLVAVCTLLALLPGEHEPEPGEEGILARARLCEILGSLASPALAEQALMAGLLSAVAPARGEEREVFLQALPLAQNLRAALSTHAGAVGQILDSVVRFEAGQLEPDAIDGMETHSHAARRITRSDRALLRA